jgi:hypothetical protein
MSMGSAVQADVLGARADQQVAAPVSLTSAWTTCVDAPAVATADNGGSAITNTATEVDRVQTHPLSFAKGGGTIGLFRLKYPAALTVIQQCKIQVRGRTGTQDWEQRKNGEGNDVVELTAAPSTDEVSADGNWKYSYVDLLKHGWDRAGCQELVPCIHTALNGTGADPATATVEGKGI